MESNVCQMGDARLSTALLNVETFSEACKGDYQKWRSVCKAGSKSPLMWRREFESCRPANYYRRSGPEGN